MGSRREMVKRDARRKGTGALVAGIGTLGVSALLFPASFGLGLTALVAGGLYTTKKAYDWLRFRGEWGLKF